jgi:outer membrane immunogenic protein
MAADAVYQEPAAPALEASVYDWSGVYVGGNIGYMWSDLHSTDNSITTTGPLVGLPGGTFAPAETFLGADGSDEMNGAVGGVQAGMNFQQGSFVYGVEADYQYAGVDSSGSFYATPEGPFYETGAELKHFGTLRGRLGYAVDTFLFYGTAGLAVGKAEGTLSVTGGGPAGPAGDTYSDKQSEWLVGYAVGAGVEAAVARTNWSVKAEYLYADFGDQNFDFSFAGTGGDTAANRSSLDAHLIRLGVNYRF